MGFWDAPAIAAPACTCATESLPAGRRLVAVLVPREHGLGCPLAPVEDPAVARDRHALDTAYRRRLDGRNT